MEQTEQLQLAHSVVGKLRQCGHYLYFRTGGKTGRRRILTILSEHSEILQKELQDILRIQAGSLSEVIIKLEADGLVRKIRSSRDRRHWALQLTETGRQEAKRLKAEYDGQILKMMSCFTPEQQEALYSQLDTLLTHWYEADPIPCGKEKAKG